MTAGPFLADEVFKRACPKWREKLGKRFPAKTRKRIELAIIIFGVFYSGFAAFKEEHAAREIAETSLRNATPAPMQFAVTEKDPQARADLATARAELKDTKKKLSDANDELHQLKRRVDDRKIEPEDRQKLVTLLKDAPKGKVIIKADWTDGEAQQFAHQISDILKEAGFDILDVSPQVLALNGKGAFMFIKDRAAPPAQAAAIQKAFSEIGISIPADVADKDMEHFGSSENPNHLESDVLVIWITRKP